MDEYEKLIGETARCGCCGSDQIDHILNIPDYCNQFIQIRHCVNCCALTPLYTNVRSNQTELQFQAKHHEEYWQDETDEDLIAHAQGIASVLEYHQKHLPENHSEQVVLDIGAGRGNLAAALANGGYNVMACEPSVPMVERARRVYGLSSSQLVDASADDLLDLQEVQDAKIKAVFLWHVLEHIENPVGLLQRLKELIVPDGVLICQGPLLSPEYVFPAHRFLHSESNITWLAKRAGLKVLMIDAYSRERFISFVLAPLEHPDEQIDTIFFHEPNYALGSLVFTLSETIRLSR